MKSVFIGSKFITYTYYGAPVDHCTIRLEVNPALPEDIRQLLIDQAREHLERMPVESFPVAGAYATLMPEYLQLHPELNR